jgi:Prp8 binding protein
MPVGWHVQGPRRTSALQAPIMLLTGHAGEVFTMKFNSDGNTVASGSHDKGIFLWRVYGDCENYMVLKGRFGRT